MNTSEVEKIIQRLTGAFNTNRFNEPAVQAEYKKQLIKYDFSAMNKAIDKLIEGDSKYVPAISALIKACKEYKREQVHVINETYCEVCDNKGYVFMTEQQRISDKVSIPYQYALYCPFCQIGQAQAYNGRECKEHKSEYSCEPLTKYFDDAAIEQMREANRKRTARLTRAEISDIKSRLARFGLRLPDLKPWEGDISESCPF